MKRIANMTPEEIDALTKEQLIAWIRELEPPPPTDWHSWMDAMLHIALHKYPVEIVREYLLGNQPPRADFLILEEEQVIDLGLGIFRIFREHNIIEFKDPGDELSVSVLWKCVGYASFYIHLKGISENQVTLTLMRGAKPINLFKKMKNYIVADEEEKGIYHIKNWYMPFPIQIIVTTELKGPEYAGFRAISNHPRLQDISQMFQNNEQETDPEMIGFYRAYWNISSRLTGDVLEEARRRYPQMERTILDIFKPEIDAKISLAVREAVEQNFYMCVQNGDMALDRAAKYVGISPSDFIHRMTEAGYSAPKLA